jgi:phosphate starvation-inducible protein PhoH
MKTISDIMYLRSAVESSDKSLGYLPGDANEKLRFYNLPLLDKLGELLTESTAQKLEDQNRVSMFPVNFARGMNWQDKCIILDEAQNSTKKEIITVLTRMGKGSRAFILADPMQTDLRSENVKGGFEELHKIFSDEESQNMGVYNFQFTEDDIMRSELVKFLIKKMNKESGEPPN